MPTDYEKLRDSALQELKAYMDSIGPDKGKKLAYWLSDYTHFLKQEQTFQPDKLIKYKRGSIVKVHLGYRVGSEEGGLHYAVVMDRENSIYSPTITVIPLTSVKPGVDLSKLHRSKVHLGNEVHTLLTSNFNAELRSAKQHLRDLDNLKPNFSNIADIEAWDKQIAVIEQQIKYCEKMKWEADRMKRGSIALVGQITTVSKIRIYDPKYKNDALSKVRVSSETLDLLDARVQELYGSPVIVE